MFSIPLVIEVKKWSPFSQISKIPGEGLFHNFWSWTQNWSKKFSYVGGVYSTTFDPELRIEVKKFSYVGGGLFHNFWSWAQKWKIYIDIFYRVSCNIKHITAIWNLYFQ